LILFATHTMTDSCDYGTYRFIWSTDNAWAEFESKSDSMYKHFDLATVKFDLPVPPTLVDRGLETPMSNEVVFRWNLCKGRLFAQLQQSYKNRYIRYIAEHLPEDISRLIASRLIFLKG
jgi:hypothetical protein